MGIQRGEEYQLLKVPFVSGTRVLLSLGYVL